VSGRIEVFERIEFVVDRKEVARLLGYVPGCRPPSPQVGERIEEMLAASRDLIEPRGCYTVRRPNRVATSGPFRGAERIAYSVCTIGKRIERHVAELSRKGETLRALILDAIGSAAVEAVTDVVNAAICRQVGQKDVFTNRRISPGYAGWPITAQTEIFDLLPTRVSGVTLKPTYFMEPRKSISAAISMGPAVPHSKYVAICGYCSLRDCAFRREPDASHPESPHR
jgi:hypothetical protein